MMDANDRAKAPGGAEALADRNILAAAPLAPGTEPDMACKAAEHRVAERAAPAGDNNTPPVVGIADADTEGTERPAPVRMVTVVLVVVVAHFAAYSMVRDGTSRHNLDTEPFCLIFRIVDIL